MGKKTLRQWGKFLLVLNTLVFGNLSMAADLEAVPGEYVVKLKPGVKVGQFRAQGLARSLGGGQIKSVFTRQNIIVLKNADFGISTFSIKSLSQNSLVEKVEPNYIYRISKLSNDPRFSELWGLRNTGQKDSSLKVGTPGVDIGAELAWDITTGSENTVVAVIDTGINYNADDLKPNMWVNTAEMQGQKGIDDDNNGIVDDIHGAAFVNGAVSGDPLDDNGHGSHCAGTIGGRGDDGNGVVGVAWNVKLMAIKFLDKDGSGTLEDAIKSIDYATKMGAKILSNSWGGGSSSDILKEAIERSHAAGSLFVAAAGNDGQNNDTKPSYPASYNVPNVLSVGAIDNRGQMAYFSNYGKNSVHVVAPGVNILSTSHTSGFKTLSGTSMATPHVSGIAALVLSANPQMTGVEMKDRILKTVKPLANLASKVQTGGIAHAYYALMNQVVPPTAPTPDPADPSQWQSATANISSSHPYKNNLREEYRVEGPMLAKQIVIYFSKFDTENKYDYMEIYDDSGKLVQKITGQNSDRYSYAIDGNKAKLVFVTDRSITRYGFDITKIQYR